MVCVGSNPGENYPNYCTVTRNAALPYMGAYLLAVVTSIAWVMGVSSLVPCVAV